MKRESFINQSKLVKKREIKGLYFVAPFIIGFFVFILIPMIQSIIYSFNDLKFSGEISLDFVGFENYKRAFVIDADFRKILLESLSSMLINVPIILIFSMLIAVFLNGQFPGRSIYQILFFIPVIVSAGIMPELLSGDIIRGTIINAESMTGNEVSMFDASVVGNLLLKMNLPAEFINYIQYAITNILEVINSSGIQILVFLIALKAIPKSLFEAANVEGATVWEGFWKITFPMVLPQMLVNLVYTIIDSFSNNVNPVMKSITEYNFSKFQFGYGAALAWVYFIIVVIILATFVLLLKRAMRHYN